MKNEAIADIFCIMREQGSKSNPPSICTGIVVTPPPNLSIKTGDLILLKDDLKVADYFTSAYERDIEITGILNSQTQSTGGGSGDAEFASHSHGINANATVKGKIKFTDTLKVGDEVAMLSSYDGNTYYVLCKVVSL